MAAREEIISVVDYHNYPSFRYSPDWIEYFFNRYGVENAKRIFRGQLERGMELAEHSHRFRNRVIDPDIICQDACYISEEEFEAVR